MLVRYNPEGDRELNKRQANRLRRLSEYLHRTGRLYMFELLVPPEAAQLAALGGERERFDRELRPELMVRTIRELQDSGVEPDVWKIEGLDSRDDCVRVVDAARRAGRDQVGCIVLGRGSNEQKVLEWLRAAADVPGFVGFAVGRTSWWDSLVRWRAGQITRNAAVDEIARRYREWVDVFEGARVS